jgi:hypothetical protein
VTPDEAAEMVRLHRSGMRQADIAAQFGRDPGNVWYVLERTGALDGSSPSADGMPYLPAQQTSGVGIQNR